MSTTAVRQAEPMHRHTHELTSSFLAQCNAQGGTVLEVGSRIVSPHSASKRSLFPGCTYLGLDVYADANTDLVGDAHRLSQHVPGQVDAVFSMSVLEHLAAPWLFALEVSKVLRLGGLTFHSTHFHWPEHELPWDFFRFSDQGLATTFCPLFGFEVLDTAVYAPGYLTLTDHHRQEHPGLEQVPCWGGSAILARKVAAPQITISPVDLALIYPGTQYPHPK